MDKFTQTTAERQAIYLASFKDVMNEELKRRVDFYNAQMIALWTASTDGLTPPLRIAAFGALALTVFQMAAADGAYLLSQDATLATTLLPAPLTAQDAAAWPTRADGTPVVSAYLIEFEFPGEWVAYADLPAAMQAGKVPTGAARANVIAQ